VAVLMMLDGYVGLGETFRHIILWPGYIMIETAALEVREDL